MKNYPDGYVMRDSVEEEFEESPAWWVQLVIAAGIVLAFLTVMFEHDFI